MAYPNYVSLAKLQEKTANITYALVSLEGQSQGKDNVTVFCGKSSYDRKKIVSAMQSIAKELNISIDEFV